MISINAGARSTAMVLKYWFPKFNLQEARIASMVRSVLVPVAGAEDDKAHLLAALAVARLFAAHMDVLHVQSDAVPLAMAATSAGYDGAAITAALIEQFEKETQKRLAMAQKTFSAFVEEERLELRERADASDAVSVAWLHRVGHPGECVAQVGRYHDVLVVGRSVAGGASGTLETALTKSGRPVLVMPPYMSEVRGRTVAIAWKDSAEAARAVTAAMPFLTLANRVEVIEVNENHTEEGSEAGALAGRLVDGLGWHGIAAKTRLVSTSDMSGPDALLHAAQDAGADLIVMGAYGHSRLREMIFGGFTRHILQAADLPVLMLH
jgi:nucleotide-binding universal stress UspA family protein